MEYAGEYAGEYERVEIKNLCVTCKRDMGPDNPRQLCGKYQCDYEDEMEADLEDIPIEEQIKNEKTNEEIAAESYEYQKKFYEANQEMYNDMYYEIKAAFTPGFYKDAKIQFSDICSNGDVYINDLLDELNLICNKNIIPDTIMEIEHYIEAIYDFYKEVYTQGGKPNPWWAT